MRIHLGYLRVFGCIAIGWWVAAGCARNNSAVSADPRVAQQNGLPADGTAERSSQTKPASRITQEEAYLKGVNAIQNYTGLYETNWPVHLFTPWEKGGWLMKAVVPQAGGIRVLWVEIEDDGRTSVHGGF